MRVSAHYERLNGEDREGKASASDNADEEAQLMRREELEFEDAILPATTGAIRKRGLCGFLKGRSPPQTLTIRPFFPVVQEAPVKLLDAVTISKKALLGITLSIWVLLFSWLISAQRPLQDGRGSSVINFDCVDTFWGRKNECGIDGVDCRPFSNQTLAFRCPAKCGDVKILNPHVVGSLEYNYRPLVIGTETYRGDSFICGSAIHAGVIDDRTGGCGRVTLTGQHENFTSTTRGGIESIPFDSYFPLSFTVVSDKEFKCSSDPRSTLLPISLFFTALLAIFSKSPSIFFPIFVLVFAHVSFASDPPIASYRNITVLPDHISMFAKRLLPATFVAVVIYTTTIKRTLAGLTAHIEKALLWLGGFWIGALSNYTFDRIPISRLTAHDLEQQPGAKLALGLIVLLLLAIILGQIHCFWIEGRLRHYLALYGIFLVALTSSLLIPGVHLRIHHYILALLLLPGTSLQTRPSLLYQGILLGLFVNGIARWDFDSLLQTSDALRADARFDSLVPQIRQPVLSAAAAVAGDVVATFKWDGGDELVHGMQGISVLVNDVERDRLFFDDESEQGVEPRFEWMRPRELQANEYFRFAFVVGGRTLDYSEAWVWGKNATSVPGGGES